MTRGGAAATPLERGSVCSRARARLPGWFLAWLLLVAPALAQPPPTGPGNVEILPLPPVDDAAENAVVGPTGPLPRPAAALAMPGAVAPQPAPSIPPRELLPECSIDDRPEPLTLSDVLTSVLLHYPLLQAAERERGVAAGKLMTAMGAFDTNVTMAGTSLAPGTYENYRSDFGLSQQLMTGGMSVNGGFRTGFGEFPTYYLDRKTADAGEWRGGLTMPFARNREIDRFRAARAQAEIDVSIVEPGIERSRLDYMRTAAKTYWTWLGSGERYGASERILEYAVDRDEQLDLKVRAGAVANIERVDNQQNIAQRRGMVVQADRGVQQAAIDLSLFHRDAAGQPLLATRRRMRPLPLPVQPTADVYRAALARALAARPEFQRLALQREKLLVDRKLAINQTLPAIDGQIVANQDAGYGTSALSGPNGLDRQVLQAGLLFQLPAQRRDARGKLAAAESQLIQIDRQMQFMEERVRADVQDAFSALERAWAFHKEAFQRLELARLVANAEREQLRLGRSDVLRVTLREQAKFEADMLEIMARQEYWRSDTDLRAADTSLGPDTDPLPPPLLLPRTP